MRQRALASSLGKEGKKLLESRTYVQAKKKKVALAAAAAHGGLALLSRSLVDRRRTHSDHVEYCVPPILTIMEALLLHDAS